MKNTIAAFLVIFLCGCATTKIQDTQTLKQDEGVLVVGLDTNWQGHKNPLLTSLELVYNAVGDSSFNYRKMKFKGEKYILVATLPAKEYYFYQISFGNHYASLKDGSRFNIKPGEITYIGEVSINMDLKLFSVKGDIMVNDELEDTLDYLKENYPKILENRDIEKSLISMEIKQ